MKIDPRKIQTDFLDASVYWGNCYVRAGLEVPFGQEVVYRFTGKACWLENRFTQTGEHLYGTILARHEELPLWCMQYIMWRDFNGFGMFRGDPLITYQNGLLKAYSQKRGRWQSGRGPAEYKQKTPFGELIYWNLGAELPATNQFSDFQGKDGVSKVVDGRYIPIIECSYQGRLLFDPRRLLEDQPTQFGHLKVLK